MEVKVTIEFKTKGKQKLVLNEEEARLLYGKLKNIFDPYTYHSPLTWTYTNNNESIPVKYDVRTTCLATKNADITVSQ